MDSWQQNICRQSIQHFIFFTKLLFNQRFDEQGRLPPNNTPGNRTDNDISVHMPPLTDRPPQQATAYITTNPSGEIPSQSSQGSGMNVQTM
jgi:hypothetical protein